jgi:hypothetical protein
MNENKMKANGFSLLLEKDSQLFFEKTMEDQYMFVIVDKKKRNVTAVDAYEIDGDEMRALIQTEIKDPFARSLLA